MEATAPTIANEAFSTIREIGRGGMGVVYLVQDRRRGDVCAAKLLHDHLALDETIVTRFRVEARAAAAIQHPAIVGVRGDIARLPDGRWYCLMEYIDGVTLGQLMAQHGPLPLAFVLELFAPLCDALELAHAAGIVHRDLKPDNVMVVVRADSYDPKLLDFGIAKLLHEPAVTRPGAAVGTIAYTAPEQTRGETVTCRADVYALGVMVYQLLTGGHLPYDSPDSALYHTQMTQPPIDPRRRYAGVPDAAVGAILSAIQADAGRRPTTAGSFLLMLASALVGSTPQTDGMAIVQRRAPRLLVGTNLTETLRAPGLTGTRSGAPAWNYEYQSVLGKGGFGEVRRGNRRGIGGFSLPVAIKRILPQHAQSPEFVEMFHTEARVSAILSTHPNIVKVIDHAIDPEGAPVIVMELIDGLDLERLRLSGPLPYSSIIYILSEVLFGLGFAHDLPPLDKSASPGEVAQRAALRGVIHRDMSHSNVMVSRHGNIKVLDFGIAKLRDRTYVDRSIMLKGKPAYLSPEQASNVIIDRRADLFAIGIMLWELLTGVRLFEGDSVQATLYAVMFGNIDRPRVHNDQVPLDLETIAMRLLEREPARRFQTAQETAAALLASPAASRNARLELQELLRERFPPADPAVVGSSTPPRAPSQRGSAGGAAGRSSPGAVSSLSSATRAPSQPGGADRASATDRLPPVVSPPSSPSQLTTPHGASVPPLLRAPTPGEGTESAPGRVSALAAPPSSPEQFAAPQVAPTLPVRPAPVLRLLRLAGAVATGAAIAIVAAAQLVRRTASTSSNPEPPRPAPLVVDHSPPPVAPPRLVSVVVLTQPSDAMIDVRGQTGSLAGGRSPLTLQVAEGTRLEFHAQRIGFAPASTSIVTSGATQTITLALQPDKPIPVHTKATRAPQPAPATKPPSQDVDSDKIIE